MSRRRSRSSKQPSTVAALAGSAVGLTLVLIPEPATTLTGAGILAAIWAPSVIKKVS